MADQTRKRKHSEEANLDVNSDDSLDEYLAPFTKRTGTLHKWNTLLHEANMAEQALWRIKNEYRALTKRL